MRNFNFTIKGEVFLDCTMKAYTGGVDAYFQSSLTSALAATE
jgi:hypothetical protein